MISFTIPGKPVAKGRHKTGKWGMYTPKETVNAEAFIKMIALEAMNKAGHKIIEGPAKLIMGMIYPIPKSWSKKKRLQAIQGTIWPTVKPDVDNAEKLVSDALNGIVWVDDKQVCIVEKAKVYGENPRVEVTIAELGG